MRVMLKIQFPVGKGNALAKEGALGAKIASIIEEQKPEAAYFLAQGGKRSGLLFLDLKDSSELPALAEPWFLAFDAEIEVTPAMTLEDLKRGGGGIQQAVEKYG